MNECDKCTEKQKRIDELENMIKRMARTIDKGHAPSKVIQFPNTQNGVSTKSPVLSNKT